MNAYEYLTALRAALAVLPDEEIDSAMRYYEDYFLDAGDENADRVIAELGPPEQVAQDILNAYTGMARAARRAQDGPAADGGDAPIEGEVIDEKPARKRGINPWVLAVLGLLAIPVGLPLAAGILAAGIGVIAVVAALVIAALALCAVLPFTLCVVGGGLCVTALFVLFQSPASAALTFGAGLMCAAVGVLLGILVVKLAVRLVPPLVRGIVAVLRWPLDKIRGVLR